MESPRDWWLRLSGGKRLRITPAGVLIGRAADCDVVLTDERASRLQAIVFAGPRRPRLTVLGKGSTMIGDELVASDRELADGDRITLPGQALEVVTEPVSDAPSAGWVLRSSSSGAFGVARSPFAIGGGAVDLQFDGWPPIVMRLHLGHRIQVEAIEPISINDVDVEPGEIGPVEDGAVIAYAGERLTLVAGGSAELRTVSETHLRNGIGASRLRLDFLPRGGRLAIHHARYDVSVYLSELRCDLVAALLRPPPPYAPGEFVPDDVLLPRVWPSQPKTRSDLNVLIHRVRRDLVRADLDGVVLVQRAPGGNATRFAVDPGAEVTVG